MDYVNKVMKRPSIVCHLALKTETLFIFLVAAYILIYNTVIIEQYSFYINNMLKMLIITSLFIFFRYREMSGSQTIVVVLYSMLLMYGLSIATLDQQFTLSFPLTLKYGLRILALIAILMILNTNRYSDKIIKFPIWIGVILSIQSILLFIMISSGNAPEPNYINVRGSMRSYGIWGFVPSITWGVNNLFIPRASSFFSEASNFARFLEYPIILSLGYYKIYGGKRYLFSLAVCLMSFILTFSLTGFIALFLGIFVFYMLKTKNILAKFLIPIFCILFVFSFHMYSRETYVNDPTQRNLIQHMLLSKYADALRSPEDIRGLYGGRVYSAIENTKLFFEYPLGVGLLNNTDIDHIYKYGKEGYTVIHIYGAFWFWLVKTGFIGISIIVLIFYIILREMKTLWYDNTDIRNYISIAFISISIHHVVSGDWIDPMFLFVMSLILAYKKRNYDGKTSKTQNHPEASVLLEEDC